MRRTLAILALSGLVAAIAGSASVVAVDGGVLQAGSSEVSCDTDGIDANWGLETDDNTVRSVRFTNVDPTCEGADMWAEVFAGDGATLYKSADPVLITSANLASVKFSFPSPYLTPEAISSVKVWIEG